MFGGNKVSVPPKPEPLTDKQVVSRMNQEVRRSNIFSALQIRKLPDKIVRMKEVDKNLYRKKKKAVVAKVEDE